MQFSFIAVLPFSKHKIGKMKNKQEKHKNKVSEKLVTGSTEARWPFWPRQQDPSNQLPNGKVLWFDYQVECVARARKTWFGGTMSSNIWVDIRYYGKLSATCDSSQIGKKKRGPQKSKEKVMIFFGLSFLRIFYSFLQKCVKAILL